jgi:UDP-N-acetylglucosamine--N-acetylmuramyl-(pentapeptide) pyrophosphoryl-undecaprenol N-acetylglucosamine transferase
MKIVITGGHHSSALPVIKELRNQQPDVELLWFGHRYTQKGNTRDTLEYKEITSLNIPFFELKAGKFYKTYDPLRLAKIPYGFFQALYLLIKTRPQMIMSFGGYLAVPTVLAGWLLGIPSITHEQTVVAGYANKLISRFAKKILVSWPASLEFFDNEKTVVTGLPLREEIFEKRSNSFEANNSLPYIYITAGKTGSHKLNEIVQDSLPTLLEFCNVIHQCGDHSMYKDINSLREAYAELTKAFEKTPGSYFVREFVLADEIGEAFSRANLVISRAGAHTVMELLHLNKPALLIPIPWVSHNEQFKNAQVAVTSKLGKLLEEKDLTSKVLTQEVQQMIGELKSYTLSSEEAHKYSNNNAAKLIVEEILKIA